MKRSYKMMYLLKKIDNVSGNKYLNSVYTQREKRENGHLVSNRLLFLVCVKCFQLDIFCEIRY